MSSRIKRWTGLDLEEHPTATGSGGAPHVGLYDPRVEQALKTALAALEAAQAKLERADLRRHVLAGVETVVGLVGVGGLATMLVERSEVNLVSVGLLSFAALVPILAGLVRATADRRREIEEIGAVATARTVAVQAAALARTLELAAKPERAEPAAKAVTDEVLAHIEQTAAALEGRERRTDVDQGLNARRHVRIKPTNERIAVTTEAGMTVIAQLVDVSISGAMIGGSFPDLRLGEEIRVGSRAAIVVRLTDRGVACEFVEPLPARSLAPNVVL